MRILHAVPATGAVGTGSGSTALVPSVPAQAGSTLLHPFTPTPPTVVSAVPSTRLTVEEIHALPLATLQSSACRVRLHGFETPRSPFAVGPFAMQQLPQSAEGDEPRATLTYVGEPASYLSMCLRKQMEIVFHGRPLLLAAARVYLLPGPLASTADEDAKRHTAQVADELDAIQTALTKWPLYQDEVFGILRRHRPELLDALRGRSV